MVKKIIILALLVTLGNNLETKVDGGITCSRNRALTHTEICQRACNAYIADTSDANLIYLEKTLSHLVYLLSKKSAENILHRIQSYENFIYILRILITEDIRENFRRGIHILDILWNYGGLQKKLSDINAVSLYSMLLKLYERSCDMNEECPEDLLDEPLKSSFFYNIMEIVKGYIQD